MVEEQIIIEVVVDNSAARKALTEQTKAVDDLTQSNKVLREENKKLSKDYAANSTEINRNNAQIAQNNVELTKQKQAQKASAQSIKATNNSLNAQKAALAANKRAIGDVNTATKQGQKEYKRLEKEIANQTKSLKKAEQAQGTFTRSVGDYGSALSQVNPAMGGAVSGFQAMTKGALAFIATPIGAVIAALGLAIGALTEYFKGSEEGQNQLLKITTALEAVFGVLSDTVQVAGKAIFDAISSPKETLISLGNLIQENLINRFKAFSVIGDAIVKIFKGDFKEGFKELANGAIQASTGIEDAIGKVKTLAEDTSDFLDSTLDKLDANLVRASQIAAKQAALDREERKLLVDRANLEVQIADNRLKAKDEETRGAEERIALLEEAQDLNDQIFAREEAQAKRRFDIQRATNAQGRSNKEDLLEQARLEADLIRVQQARLNSNRKLESEIQTNIKKRDAEQEKAAQAEINRLKRVSDAEFELAIFRKENDAKEIEDAQLKSDALIEIDIIKTQRLLENDKLLQDEKNLILEESLIRQSEIRAEADEEELEVKSALKDKEVEIEQLTAQGKATIQTQSFALATELAGENAEAQKSIAIGQAVVNTAQGVSAALGSAPPPINVILAGLTGALGAVQIAKISGVQFADGGLTDGGIFSGASHENGGIKFAVGGKINEAEGGEAIINKRSTSMFKSQLSAMNVAGGGRAFADGGINLASTSTSSIDSMMNSENSISNQLSKQIPVQVAVTDINRTQSNVSVKQTRASI